MQQLDFLGTVAGPGFPRAESSWLSPPDVLSWNHHRKSVWKLPQVLSANNLLKTIQSHSLAFSDLTLPWENEKETGRHAVNMSSEIKTFLVLAWRNSSSWKHIPDNSWPRRAKGQCFCVQCPWRGSSPVLSSIIHLPHLTTSPKRQICAKNWTRH